MTEKDCRFEKDVFYPCRGMNAMLDSVSASGIGVRLCHTMSFKDGKERDLGVYFRITRAAAKGNNFDATDLMFNVCPFCRTEILKEGKKEG